MARRVRHHQPWVRGGRDPLPACVLHDIWRHVDRDAAQFGVSRSWVIATILADHYKVKEQVSFKSLRKSGEYGPLKAVK
jgi:hypothetical protein